MSTAIGVRADKRAAKFREMAERMNAEIAQKRADRRENTPKQQREAASQRIEANHLQRVQDALLKLADAAENEGIPEFIDGIKSKTQLMTMLRTRIDTSGGYYSVRDTDEYPDQSPEAIYLRAWLASRRSEAERARDAETARRQKIADLEARVKFSDIAGFFPTPRPVIDMMLDHAQIRPGMTVLEPSAGKGDIADAIVEVFGKEVSLTCIEISHTLRDILAAKGHDLAKKNDFLEPWCKNPDWPGYDRIVLNPPFEKGQDIDHVRHAYDQLAPGGRIVAIMSTGPFYREDRKASEFRGWFHRVAGEAYDLPPDSFKNAFRSTGVSVKLVVIDKQS